MSGGNGDDTLLASSRAIRHELIGGEGNDLLVGGDFQASTPSFTTDTLMGGNGNDTIFAGSGSDELFGGAGNDFLRGGLGQDTLYGDAGADTLDGSVISYADAVEAISLNLETNVNTGATAEGDVILSARTVQATDHNDTLTGNGLGNGFNGGNGDDMLNGAGGNDSLRGGDGNDSLVGGDGNDTLYGDDDDDSLTGGTGSDIFAFGGGWGNDTIVDFDTATDKLDFRAAGLSANDFLANLVEVNGNIVVSDGFGNSLTLLGLQRSDFDSSIFVEDLNSGLNRAPAISLPEANAFTVTENAVGVSVPRIIHIIDPDRDDQTVALTITGGTAQVSLNNDIRGINGNGTANITFVGGDFGVNAALDSLTFTPTPGLSGTGAASIQLRTSDGRGGFDEEIVTFDIAPAAERPDTGALVVTTASDTGVDAAISADLAADVADGGGLSIREAIAHANSGDRIVFDLNPDVGGAQGGTIVLGGNALSITKGITIDGDVNGDGLADVTIDGDRRSRIFSVSTSGGRAVLDALHITNGGLSESGGGISVYASNLSIYRSSITGNNAIGGGGISVYASSVTITDSLIQGNNATTGAGGGIALSYGGRLTLNNSTISGNEASSTGGVSANYNTTATFNNATISGNIGGGISSFAGVTLSNSIVLGNEGFELSVSPANLTTSGTNIVGANQDVFDASTDANVINADPNAVFDLIVLGGSAVGEGFLDYNGGPVETVAVEADGPAVTNGVTTSGATTASTAPNAPQLVLPSPPLVTRGAANAEIGNELQIIDEDNDDQSVRLVVTGGTVTFDSSNVTVNSGTSSGANNVSFSGSLANVNAALDSLTFTPTTGLAGEDAGRISISTTDTSGLQASRDLIFDITSPASAPSIALPNNVSIAEDSTNASLPNGIAVSDADGGNQSVTLTITGGTANLGTTTGLSNLAGNGSSSISFSGSLTDVNNALDSLTFTPVADRGSDTASIQFQISDDNGGNEDQTLAINISGQADTHIVTTASDSGDDADVAATLALDIADGGGLSLREALAHASDLDTIRFDLDPNTSGAQGGTISLGSSTALTIDTGVTIIGDVDGDGRADVTIDANGASSALLIDPSQNTSVASGRTDVELNALNLTGAQGNGLHVDYTVNLTVNNSTISGHTGRGIDNRGTLTLTDSAVVNNGSDGVFIFPTGANNINNSTISGNGGAGIETYAGARLTVTDSTISGNSGAGVDGGADYAPSFTFNDSIILGNGGSSIILRSLSSVNFNGSNIVAGVSATNVIDAAPSSVFASIATGGPAGAGQLADNGGPVQSIAVAPGGPAVSNGQVVSGVNFANSQAPTSLLVTSSSDTGDDAAIGSDLAADMADGGGLSLREAIAHASNGATITFDLDPNTSGMQGGTVSLRDSLTIRSDVTIDGDTNGDNTADVTIDAELANDRLFTITDGAAGTLNSLNLTGGDVSVGYGGAIYVAGNSSSLILNDSRLTGN